MRTNLPFRQAIPHSVAGKSVIVFYAGKAFFLRSRNYLAIYHKTSGGIVIESGNAKNAYH
jgi:hypothetical protein